jgi:alkylhydroperoxidase family enzyme
MPRISFAATGETPFQKLMGHNEAILQGWMGLEKSLWENSTLSADLLEQVRKQLAQINGCEYCMAGGKPEKPKDNRETLALGFAQLFAENHMEITDAQFDLLREEFSEKEIAELCLFITFLSAAEKYGAVMQLKP